MDSAQTSPQCGPPAWTRELPDACEKAPPSPGTFRFDTSAADASQIAKELGDPAPFLLIPLNTKTLVIARTPAGKPKLQRGSNNADEDATLSRLIHTWLPMAIAARGATLFELAIPHAPALGDPANRINSLRSPFFKAEEVGDRVQIVVSGSPTCADLDAFIQSVHRIAWSTHSESPVARVYSLDAATASSLLNLTLPAGAHPPAGDQSGKASTDADEGIKNKNAASETASDAGADAAKPSKDESTLAPADKKSREEGASMTSQAAAKPGGDLVVFAEGAYPGDDAAVAEQKRILALLDLPRPEMIINGWVLQNSTRDSAKFGEASQLIRQTVNDHNAGVQQTILIGWDYLKQAMASQNYFNKEFYEYLTRATVLNNADYPDPLASPMQQKLSGANPVTVTGLPGRGVCSAGQYCLGYATLFEPLQPRLTNLLIAIIAAADPVEAANCAINRVEDVEDATGRSCHAMATLTAPEGWAKIREATLAAKRGDSNTLDEIRMIDETARDLKLVREVNDATKPLDHVAFCETADEIGILREQAFEYVSHRSGIKLPPGLYLECFRRTATLLLRSAGAQGGQPSTLGLTRRAIADFLFNYKMSQQYPHEFTAYDLTQSADAFNTALSPLIEAFNRDLTAYQNYLRARLRVALLSNRIASKDGLLNDGIVSVAVVSGRNASVDTTSMSYLDQSAAPELSTLASALSGSLGGGGNGKSGSDGAAAATVGKAAAAAATGGVSVEVQAALAGLATLQTTKIGISRELNLSVTPRSTVGASGAEMDVELTSADAAAPKYWQSANASKDDPDLSRVGTHHVNTHIRIDSVVLFDLSSFSAVLSKGRPLFPLLPPLVELPYIGTLAGIPLPAAKEYHSSSAIVSAVVVPTATDLAFGIRFLDDVVLDSNGGECSWQVARGQGKQTEPYQQHYCQGRAAQSLSDLANQPVREFNRRKMQCMATESFSSIPDSDTDAAPCNELQFADVLHSAP